MKSLFKTVSIILIFSIITRALGFVFRIYLSRTLGAELLGIYHVAFSFFTVLCTLIVSGIPLVISRLTAQYRAKKDVESERKTISCALIISVVASILLCLLILIFNKLLGLVLTDATSLTVLFVLLPAIIFSAIYGTFRGALWGNNQYLGVCSAELFEQVARIGLCVLFIEGIFTAVNGAVIAGVSLSIACMLSALVITIIYFCKGGKLAKPKGHYKQIFKISTPITFVRFATSLIQPLIAIIVPLRLVIAGYTESQAISQYGVAMGMTMPLLFIPGAIIGALSMALIPDLSTAVAQNNQEHITNRINSSIIFTLLVSFMFIPLYIGAGENIGVFFYNNAQSGIFLSSSAWIMIPFGITNITSSILNALGLEMKSLKNYILGAVLMLLSLWFLPQFVGIKSIIYAMGICVSLSSFLNILMLKKHSSLKVISPFVKMALFTIPAIAITSFVTNILTHYIPLFFNLAISCSLGAIFFIFLCLIFNVINISSFIQTIKTKLYSQKKLKLCIKYRKPRNT